MTHAVRILGVLGREGVDAAMAEVRGLGREELVALAAELAQGSLAGGAGAAQMVAFLMGVLALLAHEVSSTSTSILWQVDGRGPVFGQKSMEWIQNRPELHPMLKNYADDGVAFTDQRSYLAAIGLLPESARTVGAQAALEAGNRLQMASIDVRTVVDIYDAGFALTPGDDEVAVFAWTPGRNPKAVELAGKVIRAVLARLPAGGPGDDRARLRAAIDSDRYPELPMLLAAQVIGATADGTFNFPLPLVHMTMDGRNRQLAGGAESLRVLLEIAHQMAEFAGSNRAERGLLFSGLTQKIPMIMARGGRSPLLGVGQASAAADLVAGVGSREVDRLLASASQAVDVAGAERVRIALPAPGSPSGPPQVDQEQLDTFGWVLAYRVGRTRVNPASSRRMATYVLQEAQRLGYNIGLGRHLDQGGIRNVFDAGKYVLAVGGEPGEMAKRQGMISLFQPRYGLPSRTTIAPVLAEIVLDESFLHTGAHAEMLSSEATPTVCTIQPKYAMTGDGYLAFTRQLHERGLLTRAEYLERWKGLTLAALRAYGQLKANGFVGAIARLSGFFVEHSPDASVVEEVILNDLDYVEVTSEARHVSDMADLTKDLLEAYYQAGQTSAQRLALVREFVVAFAEPFRDPVTSVAVAMLNSKLAGFRDGAFSVSDAVGVLYRMGSFSFQVAGRLAGGGVEAQQLAKLQAAVGRAGLMLGQVRGESGIMHILSIPGAELWMTYETVADIAKRQGGSRTVDCTGAASVAANLLSRGAAEDPVRMQQSLRRLMAAGVLQPLLVVNGRPLASNAQQLAMAACVDDLLARTAAYPTPVRLPVLNVRLP